MCGIKINLKPATMLVVTRKVETLIFRLWALSLGLGTLTHGYAQLNSYTITRTTGIAYTAIAATAVSTWLNGTSAYDNLSTNLPIGFNFVYDGGIHTQFRVSTEGFITFNLATPATGSNQPACGTVEPYTWDNTKFTAVGRAGTLQAIAPFYNDLMCSSFSLNSSMHYQVSGSAPGRVLTVQWRGMSDYVNCGSGCTDDFGDLNFQIKLYETTNNIEFLYSTMTRASCFGGGCTDPDLTYTSGINSSTMSGAPTISQLITQQTANTATFNNTVQNSLTTTPALNSKITFTWNTPAAPGAVPPCAVYNFPANGNTNSCLNTYLSWGSTGGVPTGYDVYFGTAASPPLVSGNQTTTYYNPGALAASTTYFWKIVPKNGFGDAVGCTVFSFVTGLGNIAPASISSSAGTSICVGTTSTISVVGGNLAEGSVFNWTNVFFFDLGCKTNIPYFTNFFDPNSCAMNSFSYTFNFTGTYIWYAFVRGCNGTTSCASITITVNANNNSTPTGISSSAGNPICAGASTTLTATGGTLGAGATTQWYTGSCGGTLVGTGTSISVSPAGTTIYYVRRTGGSGLCPNTTTCISITVTVQTALGNNTVSTAQTICSGQTPAALTGTLPTGGTGAYTYLWESSTDGVSYAAAGGTNNTQNYSPAALTQTTWFRRNVTSGVCTGSNSSTSAAIIITVNPVPAAAGVITGTAAVCAPQNGVGYSVGAVSGATGYSWILPAGATIATGTNTNSITVDFGGGAVSGNVTVEGTNSCGSGTSSLFAVTVNTSSTAPTGATASPDTVCSGGSTTLTVTGGSLGAGAVWNWFTGGCGVTFVFAGSSIAVNPALTTTYYVRAQGSCNITACASVTVTVPGNGGTGSWTWQGSISTDWFNPCNWDKKALPDGFSDVIIPGGTPFQPTISGATGTCRTRTINAGNGGKLTINTGTGGKCVVTF